MSNASELFPEPDNPVTTVSVLRGMRTLMSRRLCWRAPRTEMWVIGVLSGEQREVPKWVAGQLGNFYALKVFYWSIETRVNEALFLRESQCRQRVQQSLGT